MRNIFLLRSFTLEFVRFLIVDYCTMQVAFLVYVVCVINDVD